MMEKTKSCAIDKAILENSVCGKTFRKQSKSLYESTMCEWSHVSEKERGGRDDNI